MFAKPIANLTRDDIERVATESVLEGPEVEFKETLPANKGRDKWIEGGDGIGDKARNEILEEVIAFANAFGGTLILGISETEDKPARAANIVPLPRCVDLADRLRMQCRDCIDPQLPTIELAGIPTQEDGSGVVVIRTPRSRMAPHRHKATLECYVRRADRSEKMTMREIQDLTLHVERGLAEIEAKFSRRANAFGLRFANFKAGNPHCFGVRATLLPLSQLYIHRVHGNAAVVPPLERLSGSMNKSGPYELHIPVYSHTPRPIIRGTKWESGQDEFISNREVNCDGLIEYDFCIRQRGSDDRLLMFPSWLMGLVGNALCAAERFRRAAGTPHIEYGLELEIRNEGNPLPIARYGNGGYRGALGPLDQGRFLFPRYSIGQQTEFSNLASVIEADFWNAAGHDWPELLAVDFDQAFKMLGIAEKV